MARGLMKQHKEENETSRLRHGSQNGQADMFNPMLHPREKVYGL